LEGVGALSMSMVVKGIKSGKRQMDKNTRKALKEKDHPSITFNLDEIERITPDSIFAVGTVTVAGNPVQKEWHVAYRVLDDTYIEIEGIQSLKMTDFNINPPKALLGRLKTGDDVQIEFKAYFNQQ
ncbi:MAG: YceI family protein, partial [Bacteroidota bacterium]